MTDNKELGTRLYFDAIIIVPLEEEFSEIIACFDNLIDLTNQTHIRFSGLVANCSYSFLLVKQHDMGRTGATEATAAALAEFDTGLLICAGIAGALSNDVSIGDICHTGRIIDVLDNMKIVDGPSAKQQITFSPTFYQSAQSVTIPLGLDRISPQTKQAHEEWAELCGSEGRRLIPDAFTGRAGRKEVLCNPNVFQGTIACGMVSGSPKYNAAIKALERKVIAIETESGGVFAVAQQKNISALTIRGISDYAGVDKNKFEAETNNKARLVAIRNVGSYLARQLSTVAMGAYFAKTRSKRAGSQQLSLIPTAADVLQTTLSDLSEDFESRLRDLSPNFASQARGYQLPVPRIRLVGRSETPFQTVSADDPVEVRDALQTAKVLIVHLTREYPDLSLSWIIAADLLSTIIDVQQCVPYVVDAKSLQRPRTGVRQLVGDSIDQIVQMSHAKPVFVINEFVFESRSKIDFLVSEIEQWSKAQFIIVTRDLDSNPTITEFRTRVSAISARLCEVSFYEMSYFIRKNYQMPSEASQVVAMRLRETFQKYSLPAHPSYFAGIPRTTLSALLQANRRAELIELAVAGYLSYVVLQDIEPISLSRTTREKFLTELAFYINCERQSFTEASLTILCSSFAERFDFNISPSRFVAAFFDKGILHEESGEVRFTLPFIEFYLLAKRLAADATLAMTYFDVTKEEFDFPTFGLYAELGPSQTVVNQIISSLNTSISQLNEHCTDPSILASDIIHPALFKDAQRLRAIESRLQKAEMDVRTGKDQTHEKQAFLDASDRIKETTGRQLKKVSISPLDEQELTQEAQAQAVYAVAVALLGSGAERLEAAAKRDLISKIITLGHLIIDGWTRSVVAIDFQAIKNTLKSDKDLVEKFLVPETNIDVKTAEKTIETIVDFFEYVMLSAPFMSTMTMLCEEAREKVLVQSISNVAVTGNGEELIKGLWLCDIDVARGKDGLSAAIKALPQSKHVRNLVVGHIIYRVYWKQWEQKDRLALLDLASLSLKGAGLQFNMGEVKRALAGRSSDNQP